MRMRRVELKDSHRAFQDSKDRILEAVNILKSQETDYRILIKLTKNLGDTLHVTPIARHYKTINPNCKIAFVVGHAYMSVHEFNDDFDIIMPINSSALTTQDRIKLGKWMMTIEGIDKILCPSIHPFGEVWSSHTWSYPQISHQYFHNGEIRPPGSIQGGGRLRAPLHPEDTAFAKNFLQKRKCIALEYHSYSHPVGWRVDKFKKFADLAKRLGYHCISFAGSNEGVVPGTLDGRGIPWRRTIAMLNMCRYCVGVGSGITMLACCAENQPKLIEIGVSESILMDRCGYADFSKSFNSNIDPSKVIEWIAEEDRK